MPAERGCEQENSAQKSCLSLLGGCTYKHTQTQHNTHTYIHTYISRVSLQSFSRHSRDSGCHDALQQMKTVSDERGSEQVNTERKDIATLSLTHTHAYTHIHTRTHTHTYTHARAHDTHIHTRTHLSTGMRRGGSHGAAGQYPTPNPLQRQCDGEEMNRDRTHTHANKHTHTHTHKHTHTHTRTRTHAHAHTHTHIHAHLSTGVAPAKLVVRPAWAVRGGHSVDKMWR